MADRYEQAVGSGLRPDISHVCVCAEFRFRIRLFPSTNQLNFQVFTASEPGLDHLRCFSVRNTILSALVNHQNNLAVWYCKLHLLQYPSTKDL